MHRALYLIFALVIISLGCSPSDHMQSKTEAVHETLSESDCVDYIMSADDSLGRIRNKASVDTSLSMAIHEYIESVNNLDFKSCPESFTKAFQKHINAWAEIVVVTDHYPKLRGEMHDLFGKLEQGPRAVLFEPLLESIWNSWNEVEKNIK